MKKIFNLHKMNVHKGDEVVVISGKDKGKKGIVKEVFTKTSFLLVEGVNKFKKAVKADQNNGENFLSKERPIFSSKVKVVKRNQKKVSSDGKNANGGKKNIKS